MNDVAPDDRDDVAGLYIVLISIHGLIRATDMELGRDADTGGQVKYVVELARALAAHPEVERVDLLTRLVRDGKISKDYAEPSEEIGPGARIVRLTCGPARYLRKESLWPYLDSFADQALKHIHAVRRTPDIIHGHYADAGYVGSTISGVLGVPFLFTGHSLGRVKLQRLRDHGMKPEEIDRQYNIYQRIEAEEVALDHAARVITSTRQEVEEQYELYDNYTPERMEVIPPGVELESYYPPRPRWRAPRVQREVERFLERPGKPIILALSRADRRKNLATLVRAYGEDEGLRELANLLVVAGNRDDIQTMERGAREVLTELLLLVDRHDLYGKVALPKTHEVEDVPEFYRLAAKTGGVFVNPALTEPFGLTLIEAAASGVPVVATNDGGPRDILSYCKNGLLVDPLDIEELKRALHSALGDRTRWRTWARNGRRGALRRFSWPSHVQEYLKVIRRTTRGRRKRIVTTSRSRLPSSDRVLICDIDNTLVGDRGALDSLLAKIEESRGKIALGIATGRNIESAMKVLRDWRLPVPEVLLTAVGTEIYYGPRIAMDKSWQRHIDYRWDADLVRESLAGIPGLTAQSAADQRGYKISYDVDTEKAPGVREITRHMRQQGLHVRPIFSHNAFLDILPVRASKGHALRFFAMKWGIPLEQILVAGASGNDAEMLSGNTLGVVVSNSSPELEKLRGKPRIFFSDRPGAWGVIAGLEHYSFAGDIEVPKEMEVNA